MENTTHTPAPWGIVAEVPKMAEDGATAYIIGNRDWSVKDMTGPAQATNDKKVVCIMSDHKLETCQPNIKLVCAAPELLSCLISLLDKADREFKDSGIWVATREDARQAIKLATGE